MLTNLEKQVKKKRLLLYKKSLFAIWLNCKKNVLLKGKAAQRAAFEKKTTIKKN